MPTLASANETIVRNPDGLRVCNLAGIATAKTQLVTYTELSEGIEVALRDIETHKSRDDLINKSLMVLRLTKATCDGFIDLHDLYKPQSPYSVVCSQKWACSKPSCFQSLF